jgi:hypothetical protein
MRYAVESEKMINFYKMEKEDKDLVSHHHKHVQSDK